MAKGCFSLSAPPSGTRFFHLTVKQLSGPLFDTPKGRRVEVQCDCGNTKHVDLCALLKNKVKSCGCSLRHVKLLERNYKHGLSYHSTYTSWRTMIDRCSNPNNISWASYGGRGIAVCQEWAVFVNFKNDMGLRPALTSLDRIDVNGDYCKSNCRWATKEQQFSNTRRNRFVAFDGERLTVSQWSRKCGISPGTLLFRLNSGWNTKDALCLPLRKTKRKPLTGIKKQMQQIVSGKKKVKK